MKCNHFHIVQWIAISKLQPQLIRLVNSHVLSSRMDWKLANCHKIFRSVIGGHSSRHETWLNSGFGSCVAFRVDNQKIWGNSPFNIRIVHCLIFRIVLISKMWRMFTSFFVTRTSLNFLFSLFFRFQYCYQLETIHFHQKSSDFFFFMFVCAILLNVPLLFLFAYLFI